MPEKKVLKDITDAESYSTKTYLPKTIRRLVRKKWAIEIATKKEAKLQM